MTQPPPGLAYRLTATVLRPLIQVLTKRDWQGQEHIPAEGGVIVVTNHISYLDPITFGHFVHDRGRPVRYLAKASLFDIPVLGPFLRSAGQIPVHREKRSAGDALTEACEAIESGECIVIYPEGTITRDPGLWPMVGKTGAVRVALRTGAEIIPVAQWGAQQVLKPYGKVPKFLPRKTMHVHAGPPVDLSAYRSLDPHPTVLKKATADVMARITDLLAGIRSGEQRPATAFDPSKSGVPTLGNPNKKAKKR